MTRSVRRALVGALLVTTSVTVLGGCSPATVVRVGEPAPEIRGTTLDGATLALSSLRGRPVVVNFWASWCGPCRDEFPMFKDQLAKHAGDGLAILGVVYRDDPDLARTFATEFGIGWASVVDEGGHAAAAYRVVAPPQSYFIDRQGIVRSIQIGEVREADFERQVAAIR